ncbi:MAG: protein translocase subunit SecF [Methyloprofundus sp.]|nr:protein translocase subunit SecF [Methyloprofundus sp.]
MMLKEIDFLGKRKFAAIFSGLLLLVAVGSLAVQGLKFGIDFTGGTLVEIAYKKAVDLSVMRAGLEAAGIRDATVQHFGSSQEVLIRLKPQAGVSDAEISTAVLNAVNAGMNEQGDVRRVEFVGPQVGDELTEDGGLALLYSMFGILIYVAWRFEYKFALGSVAALAHDVLITLGVFSVSQLEFDLTVLAAILAVIGYSLNDTIVVYDRIRENFRLLRKGSAQEVMNVSLNQTLSRTLMTSLTTLLVLVALAVLGGEIIHNFAIALLIGVVIGTYSSVYVASPLVLVLGVSKEDLMDPDVDVEGKEFDMMP